MKFIHGSTALPERPEEFEFSLFDYTIDNNEVPSNPNINNGIDANGPGIYAVRVDETGITDEAWSAVQGYAGKDGEGSIVGFSVDMDDRHGYALMLANEYPADHVSVEEWAGVVQAMMDERRRLQGYFVDDAMPKVESIFSNWIGEDIPPSKAQIDDLLSDLPGVDADYVYVGDEDMDPDDWYQEVRNQIEMNDPASKIVEEGGPYAIAQSAVEQNDNLWAVLNQVYVRTATESTGRGIISLNSAFAHAAINNVDDYDAFRIAAVDDGRSYVLFDTSEAKIDFIQKQTFDIPQATYDEVIDIVKTVQKDFSGSLEPEQLAMKIQDGVQSSLGLSLSDSVAKEIAIYDVERNPLYASLQRSLKDSIGSEKVDVWERRPDTIEAYKKSTDALEVENSPSLRM